ncbi:hypothetical protein BDN70DRAFT_877712 [Pholiota conissans]|uniref:Granulins domain-containing protein n=1 Tax=Pholiota conissans TaxID=109636 RepID=A0A9P6CV55_9AGAR|nr:hypothetical protein BDN70DRAFT_877712 [Pholiota conissans]
MKFSIISLAAIVAFVSQASAAPSPQGSLPIFLCAGPDHLTCPDSYHCCPPSGITKPDGQCVLNGTPCPY